MARQDDGVAKAEANPGDPWASAMPLPEAYEGGDSVWELWHDASRRLDLAFAPTEPSGLGQLNTQSGVGEAVVTEERPRFLTVHSLMVVARRNNRVCPHPSHWIQLYELLGGEQDPGLPAPPLQPWLWPQLSGLQRRLRFREHVEWAERHGCLDRVAGFVKALDEGDWVHMGDD